MHLRLCHRSAGALTTGLILLTACPPPAVGQVANPQDENIENARKAITRAGDEKVVSEWLTVELTRVDAAGDDPLNQEQAGRDFVRRIRTLYVADDTSPDFRALFAKITAAALSTALGNDPVPAKARAAAEVLAMLKDPVARDALLTCLNSTDQVARFYAARGLQAIESDIAANQQLTPVTLSAIARRGAVERNGVVAGEMYRSLNYEKHTEESIQAVLVMFTGRTDLLRAGAPRLDRAEQQAIELLLGWSAAGQLKNPDRITAVQQLATLLRINTEHFVDPNADPEDKEIASEIIQWCERLLGELVKPGSGNGPSVTAKMLAGGRAAGIDMQIELIRWIGDPNSQGLLNAAPWSVPPGAP